VVGFAEGPSLWCVGCFLVFGLGVFFVVWVLCVVEVLLGLVPPSAVMAVSIPR